MKAFISVLAGNAAANTIGPKVAHGLWIGCGIFLAGTFCRFTVSVLEQAVGAIDLAGAYARARQAPQDFFSNPKRS